MQDSVGQTSCERSPTLRERGNRLEVTLSLFEALPCLFRYLQCARRERILSEDHDQGSSVRNASGASWLGSSTHLRGSAVEPRHRASGLGLFGRGFDAASGLFSSPHSPYLEATPDRDSSPDSNNRSDGVASHSCYHRYSACASNLPCYDSSLFDFRLALLSETIKPQNPEILWRNP